MLNPKNLLPGEEQHEYYKDRVTRKRRCQYDYRAEDGTLFSCVRLSLEACRSARDEWAANVKDGCGMKSYIERVMETHPEWPRRIKHGDYIGILSGVQPLLEGESAPLYRFPGGECVGVDFEVSAVRTPAKDAGLGLACCGECGAELSCNEFGDMPDVCPVCHEGIEWSEYRGGGCGETV